MLGLAGAGVGYAGILFVDLPPGPVWLEVSLRCWPVSSSWITGGGPGSLTTVRPNVDRHAAEPSVRGAPDRGRSGWLPTSGRMTDAGINVTSMFVRADVGLGPEQVGRAVEDILRLRGMPLVDRQPLAPERWDHRRTLCGIGVSPAMAGWILVADTEQESSRELADQLATQLATPVVVSSSYEICDPPEPQHNAVYGDTALDDDQCPCLYEQRAHRYRDLAHPKEAYQLCPPAPFDPGEAVFLTFHGTAVCDHYRSWAVRPIDADAGTRSDSSVTEHGMTLGNRQRELAAMHAIPKHGVSTTSPHANRQFSIPWRCERRSRAVTGRPVAAHRMTA